MKGNCKRNTRSSPVNNDISFQRCTSKLIGPCGRSQKRGPFYSACFFFYVGKPLFRKTVEQGYDQEICNAAKNKKKILKEVNMLIYAAQII